MLEDSGVSIVLTQEKLQQKLSSFAAQDTQLIALDQQGISIDEEVNELKKKCVPLHQNVMPHHLAYVI